MAHLSLCAVYYLRIAKLLRLKNGMEKPSICCGTALKFANMNTSCKLITTALQTFTNQILSRSVPISHN